MGLRPGEADCAACVLRPRDAGGNGNCPLRTSLYPSYSKKGIHDCSHFREGRFIPKAERELKQGEALF